MRLSEWLQDWDRGLDEKLVLIDGLLQALSRFHEEHAGSRPALDPASVVIESGGGCSLEAAPRKLDPSTTSYRAPETNEGAPYAPSADIFSLGVLCYEILAGRQPFLMETPQGTLQPMQSVPAPPLRDVQPDVPRDLADAVMACLERDPEWRAKDLSYLAEVVRRVQPAGKAGRAARKTQSEPVRAATRPAGGFRPPSPRPAPSGSRLPLILASVAAMLMLVGGLWYLTKPSPPPRESPRPSAAATPAGGPTPEAATPAPEISAPAASPTPRATATPPPAAPTPGPLTSQPVVPTPAPTRAAATPEPTAPPPTLRTPPPTPVATPPPVATPRPVPSPEPTAPPPTSAPVPNGPAVLSTLLPGKLKRPSTTLVDVRGNGLRPDHKAQLLHGRELAVGLSVVGQRYVDGSLVRVMVKVEDNAAPGTYQLLLIDAQGQASNARPVEILK